MMVVHKGVVTHVIKKCPNVAAIGCPCHLIHLVAQWAASQLPVYIEDLLVDIYYYLEKSTKHHQELKKCQLLCDAATQKILKHVSTRSLSLGTCLDRLLEQWIALENFVSNICRNQAHQSRKHAHRQKKQQRHHRQSSKRQLRTSRD